MEKISRKDRVRNEVLYRIKEDRNILNTIKGRKARKASFLAAFKNSLLQKRQKRG
jgi:hypothetical protein